MFSILLLLAAVDFAQVSATSLEPDRREILQSVETGAAARARTSSDYLIGLDNWRLGLSNHLSASLGVVPFKNTFWSSSDNPGNPLYYECMEGSEPEDQDVPWDLAYRYTGTGARTSAGGSDCLLWYDLDAHWTVPYGDLERNFCRNPDDSPEEAGGRPWCYTQGDVGQDSDNWTVENCDIPICDVDCERIPASGESQTELPPCEAFSEPNPYLHAVISALTGGGVGPGDKMENLDGEMLGMTCRQDGLLLNPSAPVKATQVQILKMAFGENHSPYWPHSLYYGDLWHTHSAIPGTDLTMDYVFAAETTDFGNVSLTNLPLAAASTDRVAVIRTEDEVLHAADVQILDVATGELEIPDLEENHFVLWYLAPVFTLTDGSATGSVAALGEDGKIVRVSEQRIAGFSVDGAEMRVDLTGVPGESVTMRFFSSFDGGLSAVAAQECAVGDDGTGAATLVVVAGDASVGEFDYAVTGCGDIGDGSSSTEETTSAASSSSSSTTEDDGSGGTAGGGGAGSVAASVLAVTVAVLASTSF